MEPKARHWKKHGLVYVPDGQVPWARSHAQLPLVQQHDDFWRIYFATRNEQGQSNISYIETDAGDPHRIRRIHDGVLLPLGDLGTFDESGIMPLSLVPLGNGRWYMYYAGWTQRKTIPYHNSIGIAVSDDDGLTFRKLFKGPLLDARRDEPYFTGTAQVRVEEGLWRMWYQSCTGWVRQGDRIEPLYHIKYAESDDGIDWRREGCIAIDYATPDEGGICSATIHRGADGFEMWYCHRNAFDYRDNPANSYRIGYAVSDDGIRWNRFDEAAGIDVSATGWDSIMIAYPHFVRYRERDYLFYNGNGFGATGFGFAICEGDSP